MDSESKLYNNFVKLLMPLFRCLFKSIQWLHKFVHFVFLSFGYESFWLVHINLFFKIDIQKSSLDIMWCMNLLWINASARRILIEEILVIGEYVSKKSITFCWVKSLATNPALYLSTVPSGQSFFLKIHLQLTCFYSGGRSVRIQVLFSIMYMSSLSTASF